MTPSWLGRGRPTAVHIYCHALGQIYYWTKADDGFTFLPDVVECDLPPEHEGHHEGWAQGKRLAFQRLRE